MIITWGNNFNGQIQLIQDNFSIWFKFYNKEIIQMKNVNNFHSQNINIIYFQLINQRNQSQKDYFYIQQKLLNKKEKLFYYKDINKWQINNNTIDKQQLQKLLQDKNLAFNYMLPNETEEEQNLEKIFGFYNNYTENEIKKTFYEKIKDYSNHFCNFGKIQCNYISEMHLIWADLMSIDFGLQQLKLTKDQLTLSNQLLKSQKQI
ncbi:PX domain protein [Ichthyophthirius multifiliis]|uniref:PX domain protein n=1 Tax=Ichthyophthirius multifiliis TaxID=5932 RepID=G0QU29_ICHMU|nr:PX domain protein [Ichthyophthirius multifiliis]EGR31253.1 PX domain protein [Ichthyophthirius multifiliis]|eukprot:XP_004034739.1 PX domain protein [Ichthyophthirius multifiliis]